MTVLLVGMDRSEGFVGSDPVTPAQGENSVEDRRKMNLDFSQVVHLRTVDALV